MATSTKLDGNALIDKFMGSKGMLLPIPKSWGTKQYYEYVSSPYDASWDLLMPVVSRIQKIQQEVKDKKGQSLPMIIGIEKSFELEISRKKTYNKVLIFVRWFMRNNK